MRGPGETRTDRLMRRHGPFIVKHADYWKGSRFEPLSKMSARPFGKKMQWFAAETFREMGHGCFSHPDGHPFDLTIDGLRVEVKSSRIDPETRYWTFAPLKYETDRAQFYTLMGLTREGIHMWTMPSDIAKRKSVPHTNKLAGALNVRGSRIPGWLNQFGGPIDGLVNFRDVFDMSPRSEVHVFADMPLFE